MTEPTREPRPTDVVHRHKFDPGLPDESLLPEEVPADYVREPLFSRRVMIAWATGALMLWFGVTFIVPEIVNSIKAEIRQSMREPGTNTRVRIGDRTVIIETPPAPDPTILSSPVNPNQTYFEFQVGKPVSQIPGAGTPRYPDALRASGVDGEVQAEFVVSVDGKADVSTFRVLKATNDLFASEVRSALPNMLFYAAEIRGEKVKQLVQQSFLFELDTKK